MNPTIANISEYISMSINPLAIQKFDLDKFDIDLKYDIPVLILHL
jgi:hypothetical protein